MAKEKPGIHILFEFVDGPWGGGNQLLKALRGYFRETGVYAENPQDADIVLFNSHHCLEAVLRAKRNNPGKIFIHRVDGPIYLIRGRDRMIDCLLYQLNSLLADGTVFQSGWSREKNISLGMKNTPHEAIILNAPDPSVFNAEGKQSLGNGKVKLIATSWSANVRRGFDIYRFLDENLDFGKYEMTFVGNSDMEFRNIRRLKPVPSRELAGILKQHDIYITASTNDPCSNALIEALHCGLPAVARRDGGHPEITGRGGELFDNEKDVLLAIDKVVGDYKSYQSRIKLPSLDEIGQQYYDFAKTVFEAGRSGAYAPRRVGWLSLVKIKACIFRWKAMNAIGLGR
ncbi:glycosyltransferase [Chloroflexota bacterium]